MSKSSSHQSERSTNGSNTGMSPMESSTGADSPEPVVYVAPDVANREQTAVTRSKILVFFTMLMAVSGTATATFLLMDDEDHGNFEDAFAGLGKEIGTVTRQKVDQMFSAVHAYSLFIASEAKSDSTSSWPFVYLSDFSSKSEKIAALFGFDRPSLAIAPLVKQEQKDRWTSYVLETAPVWYQESIDNEGLNAAVEEYMDLTVPFVHKNAFVGDKRVAVETTGPSLPLWQTYPLLPGKSGNMT
eukprot:scaffold23936_cov117-Cylindrotheca_fusiformis.AAC.1